WRHRIGRATHLLGKGFKGQRVGRKVWTGSAATLPNGAVTHCAAVGHVDALSIGCIAHAHRFLRMRTRQARRRHNCIEVPAHRLLPQRPCETTSTSAGSPRLTTATAFFKAGPRSLGSAIGPKDATPRPFATVA